jgi:hypothetical protein
MIVAQVIDAVIAGRLRRGPEPDASSPNDADVSPAVPMLRIGGNLGKSRRACNRCPWDFAMSGKRDAKAWCPGAHCLTEAAMRYSRYALLLFGAGMLLGLVVVSAKLPGLERVASLAMAGGIVLLPVATVADWRRRVPRPRPKARAKTKSRSRKPSAAAPVRPRRPRAKR